MIEVTLRVTGIDLDNEAVDAVMAERFPETMWEALHQFTTLTVFVEPDHAIEEIVEIARALEGTFKGLVVRGVHRDLVGTTDISQRVGVSREAARKWAQSEEFPDAFDVVSSTGMKLWAWTEVVTWLQKTRALNLDEELPSLELMAQIEACLTRNTTQGTVQWLQATKKITPVRPAFKQAIKPAARLGAGGRAQKVTRNSRDLVGSAAYVHN